MAKAVRKFKRPTILVIDRAKWYRGKGANESRLLRPEDGMMCCLGFYSLACGLSEKEIKEKHYPYAALGDAEINPPAMRWLRLAAPIGKKYGDNTKAASNLANVNDDPDVTERQREKFIKQEFLKHGITVKFKGRPAP